jgi:hypothetical protein
VVFGDFSRELLGKEVPLQAFVHVGIQPHVNKPPRAS